MSSAWITPRLTRDQLSEGVPSGRTQRNDNDPHCPVLLDTITEQGAFRTT